MKTTATALLKKQHRTVETLFKKILAAAGSAKATPFVKELATDLAAHMVIEQTIFYPTVMNLKKDLVLESFEEHACAQFELTRILATAPTAEAFEARVTTLKELIEHHVKEEESDLFPKVDKALGAEKNEALGAKMNARFEELTKSSPDRLLTMAKDEIPSVKKTTKKASSRSTSSALSAQ